VPPDELTPEAIAAAEAEAQRQADEAAAAAANNNNDDEAAKAAELAKLKNQAEADEAREAERKALEAQRAKPTDAEASALKEIMKWKERAKKAEERADLFKDIDPNKAKAALAAQAEAERKEMEARGEYDRIVASITDQHAKELSARDEELTRLRAELAEKDEAGKKKDVANQFANSHFVRENLTISGAKVQVLFGDHFDFVGDELVGYDKPRGAAERTPLVDGQGKYLQFDAALEKVVKADPEFANVAKSKIRPGAGSVNSGLNHETPVVLNTSKDKILAGLGSIKKSSVKLRE
jgi:hypothetical protein